MFQHFINLQTHLWKADFLEAPELLWALWGDYCAWKQYRHWDSAWRGAFVPREECSSYLSSPPTPPTSWLGMWRFKCALWFLFTRTSVHTYFHLISKAYVCVCAHMYADGLLWTSVMDLLQTGWDLATLKYTSTGARMKYSSNEHRRNHTMTFTIHSTTVYSLHGHTTAYWHFQGHVQSTYIALQNVWEGKIKDEDTNSNLSVNMCRALWFSWYNADTQSHITSLSWVSPDEVLLE